MPSISQKISTFRNFFPLHLDFIGLYISFTVDHNQSKDTENALLLLPQQPGKITSSYVINDVINNNGNEEEFDQEKTLVSHKRFLFLCMRKLKVEILEYNFQVSLVRHIVTPFQ